LADQEFTLIIDETGDRKKGETTDYSNPKSLSGLRYNYMQYLIMTKKMNNLQLSQKDMEKEIAQLEYFIKSDIDARELKRAIAVRMALSGKLYYEISKMLGVSKFFGGYWKKIFKTQGIAGIKLGYKGSQGYLTERQTDVVVEWFKE
jgi:putative transposase